MSSKRNNQTFEEIRTTLGTETVFNGTLRFVTSLKINGKYEGRIESTGFLYIEEGAEVLADIRVKSIVVAGVVKGNIEATEMAEMLDTGKVYGNIRTGRLKMAHGVVFEGKVEMIKDAEILDIFAATPAQLKQSLESV